MRPQGLGLGLGFGVNSLCLVAHFTNITYKVKVR